MTPFLSPAFLWIMGAQANSADRENQYSLKSLQKCDIWIRKKKFVAHEPNKYFVFSLKKLYNRQFLIFIQKSKNIGRLLVKCCSSEKSEHFSLT